MGFFQAMGRIMSGKPVFKEGEGMAEIHSSGFGAAPHVDSDESEAEHDGIIKNNPSTFPVAQISRFKTYHNGHEMEISCEIKNLWHQQVIVQTVRAFGGSRQLGIWLRPEQAHEAVIYKGPAFSQQPSAEILLDYKTEHEGDYFESVHDVHFMYTADKTYDISDIRPRMPIRDIYG